MLTSTGGKLEALVLRGRWIIFGVDDGAILGIWHVEASLEDERRRNQCVNSVCMGRGAGIDCPQPWGFQARVAMVTASLGDRGPWRLERGWDSVSRNRRLEKQWLRCRG